MKVRIVEMLFLVFMFYNIIHSWLKLLCTARSWPIVLVTISGVFDHPFMHLFCQNNFLFYFSNWYSNHKIALVIQIRVDLQKIPSMNAVLIFYSLIKIYFNSRSGDRNCHVQLAVDQAFWSPSRRFSVTFTPVWSKQFFVFI